MSKSCPRIVIAGVSSGVGKTSVTLAVVRALRKRGLRVQVFKVGPDFLDPTYLSIASGQPCYNLDGWMAGPDYMRRLFEEKSDHADIAVIEGVMGLFDGSDPVGPEGSTAETARLLDAPVILVVNTHGMARSVAALVKGYAEFDSRISVAGVIANHCGSERHGSWMAESLGACKLPPVVAAIPRGAFPELPSRHLGLVTADSRNLTESILDALAAALERYGSVDEILRMAGADSVPSESRMGADLSKQDASASLRLGVALDEAFHFYYPDNLEALEAAGFELVYFSPISRERLPEDLDAVYIGGGYPETHAASLAENRTMLESIRRFAQSGRPLYAECGGLMYLAQGIELLDGVRHELVGLLPQWTKMLAKRRSLGYVEVSFSEDSLFARAGDKLRGHEFHYSELTGDPASDGNWRCVYSLKRRRNNEDASEGFQCGNILASYVHAHFASRTEAVQRFAAIAAGRMHS
ncbi:MAG: cobyrinate a,c-diamide synthase [Desulfomonile tiedjei]|uniref:Cobyrinate a,c-diamide synthase n=1 Tax=Desulfomonile tiedjei TaxID=2358 RepID=A0A9D6Z5X3_9BACT|nr:cobyrinate a,c-diamide synthase [Desulfomonile tiedjei]